MDQPHSNEQLAIQANVDQLVQELHHLSSRAASAPSDGRQQSGSTTQAATMVATGR